MSKWPTRKIGDVLSRVKSTIEIDDATIYSRVTIRLGGKGVMLRDRVIGAKIGTKRQFVARSGQFILSKIDARNGAFGVLPVDCDNSIVTGNFWVFDVDSRELDKEFFNYLCKSPEFVNACVVASDGTTNRRYLQEDAFLNMEVPVPPLDEQQAIVTKLDALCDKVNKLSEHLDIVEADADRLLDMRFRQVIADAAYRRMHEVAPLTKRPVELETSRCYREVGARSFGKGLFEKPDFNAAEATWEKPVWIKSGDVVFSNIKAWEGAIALAYDEHDGAIASHRYISCVPNSELLGSFLLYYLLSTEGLEKIGDASAGTADRNRTLSITKLPKIEVPVPPLKAQREFTALQAAIVALKAKHAAIRHSLAALVPATLERIFRIEQPSEPGMLMAA